MALKEHDAKQLYMARQHLVDIKNIYAVLTDVIHKNITKVGRRSDTLIFLTNFGGRFVRRKVIIEPHYTDKLS